MVQQHTTVLVSVRLTLRITSGALSDHQARRLVHAMLDGVFPVFNLDEAPNDRRTPQVHPTLRARSSRWGESEPAIIPLLKASSPTAVC